MAVNIGPKIGIEGEKEYRKQINDLITQQKTFSAEMKELESSFDETTSAMEKNRKKGELLEKQIANQEKQVEELEKGLEQAKKVYGENATETNKWKQAVANSKTELNKMKKALNDIPKPIQQVGKSMQETGKKISSFGESFTKKISAPVAALGALSIAAFNEVDEGLDIVTKKTGATGEQLESLQGSVKALATQIPTDFATAGEAIGEVNTRFGLTGTELETLSGQFVKFAELNDTDVSSSVDNVQKIMAAFGVETKDAGKVLDVLNRTGQNTGISMDTLESSMLKNATALQNMGMDAYDAATFLGQVETSGANTETVMQGMSKALTNAAEDGKTLPQALSEFQSVMNSSATEQEKLNAAIDLFGKKAGPAIYEACKQGSLSFESLSSDASEYLGSVENTFEETLDAPDKMKVALNNLKTVGSELGGTLLNIATPAIDAIGEAASTAGSLFDGLTEDQKEMVGYIVGALAIGGPAIVACGNLVTAAGQIVEAFGAVPGAIAKISGVALPVGVAIAAFTLLKMGIDAAHDEAIASVDGLAEMLSTTSEQVGTLNSTTADLKSIMTETSTTIDSINSKAATAGDLIDELYDLDAVSEKTISQQERMKAIVAQLNSMYPDLGLAIDGTTGKLSKGKQEVKNYVEQAKKLALLEAYTSGAKLAYEKLADAEKVVYEAKKEQQKGLETLTTAYHQYYEALEAAPTDVQTGQKLLTEEVQKAQLAYDTARDSQLALNKAVHEAEGAIADCNEECEYYVQMQDELSTSTEESTESTEESTAATEEHTAALQEESSALQANAAEMAARTAQLASDITTAVAKIGEEVTAWDDLYEATKDSIEGQLGLFDEWTENTDLTAEQMLANLQSQGEGMQRFSENMGKLSKAAVKSADPNFKALVKSIAEMGIDGAGEAQTLVNAMENDKDTFNAIVSQFGANHGTISESLAPELTYIESDFQTRAGAAFVGVLNAANTLGKSEGFKQLQTSADTALKAVGKEITTYVASTKKAGNDVKTNFANGYSTLPSTAAQASQAAKTGTETTINGMNLKPEVKKIQVPESVTTTAKQTITNGVDNIHGKVTKVDGAKAAAQTAASDASSGLTVTASLKVSSDSISSAIATVQHWFNSNPITTFVRAITSVTKHAEGGFTDREQLSWLSEGNKPEVVIPLAASQRANALNLYEQTGQILGVQRATAQAATMSIPSITSTSGGGGLTLNTDEMYAAVAAAAKRGMESANIRIYWNNREAGRIMRDMGVQFA